MWFCTLVGGLCGSSAENPANVQCVVVGSCEKSTQGHLREFSVFEDSVLDCESKLLLVRQVREYISLLLPYPLYCKQSAK